MLPQSHDATIIHGLFHQNQYTLDIERCSDVYDEAGHLIKLSLTGDRHLSDEPDFLVLPENFYELTSLNELYIYAPLVSFPRHFCQMTSLRAFVLSDFCPSDAFPAKFAQLTNLRYLGLGGLQWI